MVEFGDSLDLDKEFDAFLDIWNFPMDYFEGGEDADDWDIGNEECLGHIPSNILMELPMISIEEFDSAPISGAPEQSKLATVQESGTFDTQSHVSVLESSGSCSREKSLSIKSDNAIPPQNRSKPASYTSICSELSTSKQTSNARTSKESGNMLPVAMDLMRNSPEKDDGLLNISQSARQITSKPRLPLVKKCANCQSSDTSKWKEGPLGAKTLCNECGVRYRSGHLFPEYRSLASPTFVPSQRLNSHKKVANMRDKPKQLKGEIKIDGAPEQKQQHVDDTSSHVSLLESSPSYLQYRSKYLNRVDAKPWIPPSPPCEKTSGEENPSVIHLEDDDESLDGSDCVLLWSCSNPSPSLVKKNKKKKCAYSKSTKTPAWSEGPLGPHTLCNARGVRHRAGQLVPVCRPEANTSFVPCQHSDSQRKLKQMRIKANKITRTPEQKQIEHMQVDDTSSDVSLLESGCSFSIYRSKYVEQAGAEPWVPPSSPCEKTSHEEELFEVPVENYDDYSYGALLQNASNSFSSVVNKCTHCQSTKTLEWREGLLGPCTLCDACGEKYRAGLLVPEFQPYASPMLVSSQHSKSPRKPMQSTADIKIDKKKCCAHCQAIETPRWRKGPLGPRTLCNACGKQYQVGRLFPEYQPRQRSNSHLKLVKMTQSSADIKINKEKRKKCANCGSTETPQWREGSGPLAMHADQCRCQILFFEEIFKVASNARFCSLSKFFKVAMSDFVI